MSKHRAKLLAEIDQLLITREMEASRLTLQSLERGIESVFMKAALQRADDAVERLSRRRGTIVESSDF
ncbi:hypothetical protein WP12_22585 [Sphingomonas sp. SRS2]|nr:hypothetical protein WP12_22585 [Sphingomonas sp. SRS2]